MVVGFEPAFVAEEVNSLPSEPLCFTIDEKHFILFIDSNNVLGSRDFIDGIDLVDGMGVLGGRNLVDGIDVLSVMD